MPASDHEPDLDRFQPVALGLGFLIPGLGHAFMGYSARGACIFTSVGGLFVGGLAIAGIDAVDSSLAVHNFATSLYAKATGQPHKPIQVQDGDAVWFLGTMFVGPAAFAVDYAHQFQFKVNDNGVLRSAKPNEARGPDGKPVPGIAPNVRALGRSGEIGTLCCTLAGMINLIALIDVAYSRRRRSSPAASTDSSQPAATTSTTGGAA